MKYIDQALGMGAKSAVRFDIGDIVFDPRTVLKCLFGCGDYGRFHTCPYQKSPLTMREYHEIFARYRWGVIIGCLDKVLAQKISFEVERAAFLDGYHYAFSLSDCALCAECAKATDKPCRVPIKARPAFHAIGIDVFTTVQRLGLPLTVARTRDAEVNWYAAVFIE